MSRRPRVPPRSLPSPFEARVTVRRPRAVAAAATGLALLAQLWIAREVLTADDARAYFLGRPIGLACGFRARFGVPCPGCGITRAIAFAIHGNVAHAWRLFPAAPLAILGLAGLAVALLELAWLEWRGVGPWPARAERWIRAVSVAYAGATATVWLGEWALRAGAAMLSA